MSDSSGEEYHEVDDSEMQDLMTSTGQGSARGGGPPGGTGRPYRAKGPTLGKGKACEACRARRIRCNGVRPSCFNCTQAGKECVYLDKPRPPSSAAALSARLATLEERYRLLSEVETNRRGPEGNRDRITPEAALNWASQLDFNQLPPQPEQAREPTPDALDDPFLERTMGKTDRKLMIRLSLRECYRYAVSILPTGFVAALEDPDPSKRPHPCLINAMVLVALDFANTFSIEPILDEAEAHFVEFQVPDSTPSEEQLLARTQAHMAQSLADVDRLQDYIAASLLLSFWYFRQGRLMEGQYSMAVSCRLVINCKLNSIDGDVLQELAPDRQPPLPGASRWDGTLLGRPENAEELAIRISLFWQSFYGDKTRALMTGLPPTYDDSESARITTVWPRMLDEYISGSAFQVPYTSYGNLFDGSVPPANPPDRSFTYMFKGTALLDRALKYMYIGHADALEITFLRGSIARVLTTFERAAAMGPMLAASMTPSRGRYYCEANYKCLVQLFLQVANLYLSYVKCSDVPSLTLHDEVGYQERLSASHKAAELIQRAFDDMAAATAGVELNLNRRPGIDHLCYMSGLLLGAVSTVLVEEIRRLRGELDNAGRDESPARLQLEEQLRQEEQRLALITETLEYTRETYPIVDLHLQRIQAARTGSSSSSEDNQPIGGPSGASTSA